MPHKKQRLEAIFRQSSPAPTHFAARNYGYALAQHLPPMDSDPRRIKGESA
jgi:hypothetical protein